MADIKYNPARNKKPKNINTSLEVSLVYQVRSCGTCKFFWPDDPKNQPYGPFPAFDFPENFPKKLDGLKITTQEPSFPNGEIMDGCRKAPIMTIGINPNLTAFSPGKLGTSWVYPNFTSNNNTNAWAKYAFYYRYRSVYQERFDFKKVKTYIQKTGRVIAQKDGVIISANRTSSSPNFDLVIQYKGSTKPTTIKLSRKLGTPRYVLLFNRNNPGNKFKKGDVIAGRLNIPSGQHLTLHQELQTYYEQFVPSLNIFEKFLKKQGHIKAKLRMGEDVCQLDMVACASPHWNPDFLGGTKESENQIIDNCVHKNAWAIKQLVQTRPTVLFLVGESSWTMFKKYFGKLVFRDPPLSTHPYDGAFTLFAETINNKYPAILKFSKKINGINFNLETRIIITPHFSYDNNFMPQFRLNQKCLETLTQEYPDCIKFLKTDKRIQFVPATEWSYDAFIILKDKAAVLKYLKTKFPDAYQDLQHDYFDPHQQMADVLQNLYSEGKLNYSDHLLRSDGACRFCVNEYWQFPEGCPYGNIKLKEPPAGTLEQIAQELIKYGS